MEIGGVGHVTERFQVETITIGSPADLGAFEMRWPNPPKQPVEMVRRGIVMMPKWLAEYIDKAVKK